MSDFVYPPVIVLARTLFRVLDLRISVNGAEHVPGDGGAVLASNHVSYLDFIFCGFGALPAGRRVRFLAKQEIFAHRIGGPLMRGMHHIPVDRDSGVGSYRAALAALRDGEVVGVFPEATISQSFTVKEIKGGAARMAASAGVPLIPMALWGGQRLWTKGRPRALTQRHIPISILVGEPLHPGLRDNHAEVTAELHRRMSTLLDRAQREYPDKPANPDDGWWVPAHLGGSAPTPESLGHNQLGTGSPVARRPTGGSFEGPDAVVDVGLRAFAVPGTGTSSGAQARVGPALAVGSTGRSDLLEVAAPGGAASAACPWLTPGSVDVELAQPDARNAIGAR